MRCEETHEYRDPMGKRPRETIRCDKWVNHKGPHEGALGTDGLWRIAWHGDDYDYSARWREAVSPASGPLRERTRA